MNSEEESLFIRYDKYPNAKNLFNTSIPNIEEIKDNAIFVLDTNVLLKPYEIQFKENIEIKNIYQGLLKQKRLLIPGQVAREFIENRPQKLQNIDQKLSRHYEKIVEATKTKFLKINYDKYSFLSDSSGYEDLMKLETELNNKAEEIEKKYFEEIKSYDSLLENYRKKFSEFKQKIEKWNWRDPISVFYAELFKGENVYELDFTKRTKEFIDQELRRRYKNRIPPGYKDQAKIDNCIGDLIIWFTIIEIAETHLKDIIFVSGDEKTDWFLRGEKGRLYPRFELINEFKQYAPKNNFSIINFKEFLEIMKATPTIVERVEKLEILEHRYFHQNTFTYFYPKSSGMNYPVTSRISNYDSFQNLLDEIYFKIDKLVEPFSYGEQWILVNQETRMQIEKVIEANHSQDSVTASDQRTLDDVGIYPGSKLKVVLLKI